MKKCMSSLVFVPAALCWLALKVKQGEIKRKKNNQQMDRVLMQNFYRKLTKEAYSHLHGKQYSVVI